MIKVKRQGDNPSIPLWFLKELKLIDSGFIPFWDKKAERWLIVSPAPVSIFRKGYVAEYCVSKGRDYTPLDGRTLFGIKKILYFQNRMRELDEHLEEMKESDEQLSVLAEKEWQGLKREFMKKLWRLEHTETFI